MQGSFKKDLTSFDRPEATFATILQNSRVVSRAKCEVNADNNSSDGKSKFLKQRKSQT